MTVLSTYKPVTKETGVSLYERYKYVRNECQRAQEEFSEDDIFAAFIAKVAMENHMPSEAVLIGLFIGMDHIISNLSHE